MEPTTSPRQPVEKMATQGVGAGARRKVKEEALDSEYAECGSDFDRAAARVARTARRLAADAGFGSSVAAGRAGTAKLERDRPPSGAHATNCQPHVKTPKFSGKADWEAFHAQFELLARAAAWSDAVKALQLALCLTDDALACLLLLSPAERDDYDALVGALQRRFGQCTQTGVLRAELTSRQRRPGEPLRALANDIETLARRAYGHMPTDVQNELARDQFIRAVSPRELRIQTQLAHPRSLQEALELAVEREAVGAAVSSDLSGAGPVARAAVPECPSQEKPAWAAELTELIRAVSLQSNRGGTRPRRGPPVCWTCGQPGHISVHCPKHTGGQGNASGPA